MQIQATPLPPDTSDATAPQYKLGENVILTSNNPEKTIYAVWRTPSFISGTDFNNIFKNGNFTNVIFGSFNNYKDYVADSENRIVADSENTGAYEIYTTNSTIYVLSKIGNIIYANKDCSNMFNSFSMSEYDFTNFDTSNVESMHNMFSNCSSVSSINLNNFSTSNVSDLSGIFSGCSSLASVDLSQLNTENCTDLSDMFNGCSSLTSVDLSKLNTANCTDLSGMFSGCSKLTSLRLI